MSDEQVARIVPVVSWFALVALISASVPVWRLCRAHRQTALFSASVWAAAALGAWALVAALALSERVPGEWIGLGFARLAATAFAVTPLIAVLGARWPGARAWNLIVLTLLVVFLLPVLNQMLLGRPLERGRAGMDTPPFVFFWIVAMAGLGNYLPTRFGPAAFCLGVALAIQSIAVGPWPVAPNAIALLPSLASIMASSAAWLAWLINRRTEGTLEDSGHFEPLNRTWRSFRDAWGVVWSIRLSERWNAAARHYGWPLVLSWWGIERNPDAIPVTPDQLQSAERELLLLLKRFATPRFFDEQIEMRRNEKPTA